MTAEHCRQVILDNGLLPVIVSLVQKNLEDPGMVLCGLVCMNYLAYHSVLWWVL